MTMESKIVGSLPDKFSPSEIRTISDLIFAKILKAASCLQLLYNIIKIVKHHLHVCAAPRDGKHTGQTQAGVALFNNALRGA